MLGDEFISQDELDAILNGLENNNNSGISDDLKDMMGEIGNIAMGSGATTLSMLLRRKVNITSPDTKVLKFKELKTNFNGAQLVVIINYKKGLEGVNSFVLPANIALVIANLMMGGEGVIDENEALDEISMSAVAEAMNQMMGSASTAMSDFLKTSVDISPPDVKLLDFSDPGTKFPPLESDEEAPIISIKFTMEIEGMESTTFWQFIPLKFAEYMQNLMFNVMGGEPKKEKKKAEIPHQQVQQQPVNQNIQQNYQQQPPQQQQFVQQQIPVQQDNYNNPYVIQQGSGVTVNPVNFGPISGTINVPKENVDLSKLQLLMDVPLKLTVELGNVNMSLREVLQLHQGSMIQLDKLAGEPLDVYANGRLIARGEVVVIEENFGIRITEIVSLEERLRSLK